MKKKSDIKSIDEETGEGEVINLGNDDYDPKTKNEDKPLSCIEKLFIILGSLIFVIILVSIKHPDIYKKESYTNHIMKHRKRHYSINDTKIIGYATKEGTALYANNFNVLGYNILGKECDLIGKPCIDETLNNNQYGLYFSAIGIGTYLGEHTEEEDELVTHAVLESVLKGGINVIDTAINYRGQKAERCIRNALRKIFSISKSITRESIFISTKAGFIPSDADNNWNARRTAAEWASTVTKFPNEEIVDNKHCISPICLEKSLNSSLVNLGLETIDLFYLHNVAEKQLTSIPREKVMERLEKAFEYLEKVRAIGMIRFYGLATWTCFRVDSNNPQYLSLKEVYDIATKVGGENHGFRFIQVPLTSSMPEAAIEKYQDGMTLIEKAISLKITLVSSRSIDMGNAKTINQLDKSYYECINVNGMSVIDKATKVPDGAALALQVTRSTPGLSSALVGMKKTEHIEENLKILKTKRISSEVVQCIYENEEKVIKDKKVTDKKNKISKEDKLKKKHTLEDKKKRKIKQQT